MKKIAAILLIFTLTSCSYLTEFFIYNNSSNPIQITYVIKYPKEDDVFVSNPKIKAFKSYTKIQDLENAEKPSFNAETLTLTASLQPKQALWIGADTNFSLASEYDAEMLRANLNSLKIETSKGVIQADNATVLSLFKTYNNGHIGIAVEN